MERKKDKISYLVIKEEPEGLIDIESQKNAPFLKRLNSLKRIEQSYNYMQKGVQGAHDEDLIILSDNDEIPNLESRQFQKSSKDLFIFKQLFFYYKFNLLYEKMYWFGSKACKKKKLKSFSWLRNIKNKRYPIWRFDTYFSDLKNINLEIIDEGGWHFTNIKTPEDLFIKMKNFGHHDEFDESGLTVEDIEKKIKDKRVFYNHFVDKNNQNKWKCDELLKIIDPKFLPKYLINNYDKFGDWMAK